MMAEVALQAAAFRYVQLFQLGCPCCPNALALLPVLQCAGPNLRRGLTRRRALQFFSFLVSPHSGLAQRVLDHDPSAGSQSQPGAAAAAGRGKAHASKQQPAAAPAPPSTPASAANLRLRQSLLEFLKAAFAAPGSPFVADKFVSGGRLALGPPVVQLHELCLACYSHSSWAWLCCESSNH